MGIRHIRLDISSGASTRYDIEEKTTETEFIWHNRHLSRPVGGLAMRRQQHVMRGQWIEADGDPVRS